MATRTVLIGMTLAFLTLATGCNGPTKAGIEARENARGRLDSFNAQFAYDAARQEFESGQFDRAMKSVLRASEAAPEVAECDVLRGRIHLEKQELDEALAAFDAAIVKNPELAEARYYAGIVYQRWSEDEDAYASYNKARELEPSNVHYLLAAAETLVDLGETDSAEQMIRAKMNYFEHDPALRQLLAQIALLQGDTATAVRMYANARMLDPDNTSLLEELVWTQYDAGYYAQCYNSVKELQGKVGEDRLDLVHIEAGCLSRMGRAAEAHRLYMELTAEKPNDVNIWIEFGTLAWELNDRKRLEMCAKRAMSLAPERHEGYLLMGVFERERGNLDEAISMFKRAGAVAPDVVLPQLMLGRTLEENGNPSAALLAYENAVEASPGHAEARVLRDRLEQTMQASVPTE